MLRVLRLPLLAILVLAAAIAIRPDVTVSGVLKVYSRITVLSGVQVQREVSFGPHPRDRLDIYNPSSGAAKGPIVLFIHGGSWRSGEKDMYGFVGAALAAHGLTTIIPNYRLYPEVMFPGFITDSARAYAFAARSTPGAHARGIVLMGHSAGAYIAAMLALDARYLEREGPGLPKPTAFVGLAGPYAFDPTTWPTTKDIFFSAPSADEARPVAFAGAHAPPALLMHGLADETVKLYNTRDLATALQRAGVAVEKAELQGIGHFGIVLALARGFRWRAPVLERVVGFVQSTKIDSHAP
jgi:acetyl esterase/lipase